MPAARLSFIDALRGIAIALVVLVHTGQQVLNLPVWLNHVCKFGTRGVQLFFLLSALTLSTVATDAPSNIRSFYLRRFFRIAPMFYLAIIFYLVFGSVTGKYASYADLDFPDLLLTLLFLHGMTVESVSYIVPGGWSIACEVAFYLCFPILMSWITTLNRAILFTITSFVLTALWARFAAHWFAAHPPLDVENFIYFGFVWNLPAFALGLLLHHVFGAVEALQLDGAVLDRAGYACVVAACAALAMASLSYGVLNSRWLSLLSFAMLAFGLRYFPAHLFLNPGTVQLGIVSYSIYLVHWALLPFWSYALSATIGTSLPAALTLAILYALNLVSSYAVAIWTYRYVEQPGIALGRWLTARQPLPTPIN